MSSEIKVMVVDDSPVVRKVMSAILDQDPGIRVIGTAHDPIFAIEKMRRDWPDVVTLDIEMPRMDGITFLRQLMAERPTPVIVCSSLTTAGAETTLQALAAGAVAIVAKPGLGVEGFLKDSSDNLVAAVKSAARANMGAVKRSAQLRSQATERTQPRLAMAQTTERIVAIGTSTGGTVALEVLLGALPRVSPGMVIVQHMPAMFTASFAARLNTVCEVRVEEAKNGQRVLPGVALIAPGGKQMQLARSGAQYIVEVREGPPVNRHCPSVDVLFRSVAKYAGKNAMGVIMTGMGDDGARGLKEMHDAGAFTLAQDEESCVVYGMPREAVKLGAVDRSLPLSALAASILRGA
ncbi:protein-glutamate methylesterase/protein-glutamine glutaminase [Rhodocyclus tenuis]|uniref:Protein-glutamate methylesterase/protein-glutamine glutaminase n=1 Tax=Rhodocyclus tenuis TaxID=1066 RepID=A0A840GCF8_RHOTE|nr:chemotaxis response regulator protein-glutamate methylesterase [Rhodocyclus tenuis]MBB4245939.1 two-component system chemotaxis response regulator CheB [Rhodocyclus tenuis]MBK1680493.1 chemotaxis response regulator protein-glutamate methylesterase [Rhodocyclus tenuis]